MMPTNIQCTKRKSSAATRYFLTLVLLTPAALIFLNTLNLQERPRLLQTGVANEVEVDSFESRVIGLLKTEKYEELLSLLEQGQYVDPDSLNVVLLRAQIYAQYKNNPDMARKILQVAMKKYPQDLRIQTALSALGHR